MSGPRARRPARSHRPWLAFALALALLFAQGLGSVHRALHGAAAEASSGHALVAAPHVDDDHRSFGHAPGDAQCRLLDHLAIGDAATPALPAAVLALPGATPHASRPALEQRPASRAFDARAPPRVLA